MPTHTLDASTEIQNIFIYNEEDETFSLASPEELLQESNTTSEVTPDYIASEPGWSYDGKKVISNQFHLMIVGTGYQNRTMDRMVFKSKVEKTTTYTTSVEGELTAGWGPVNAKAGYNLKKSFTWKVSTECDVIIRRGYKGWVDFGVEVDIWKGSYYYTDSRSQIANKHNVTLYVPGRLVGIARTTLL